MRIHGTTRERPVDRFAKEKIFLMQLPSADYDASIVRDVKANSQALIHFDGNTYSVPFTLAYKPLLIKASAHEIRICKDGKQVARHKRSYERGMVIENPKHYEGLLATKKKAFFSKMKDSFLKLGGSAGEYLSGMMKADLHLPHHLYEIMECVRLYGRTEVRQAIEHALKFNAFGAPYLKNIILQQRARRGLKETPPIVIPSKPAWTQLNVEEQDLSLYDDMFEEEEETSDEKV